MSDRTVPRYFEYDTQDALLGDVPDTPTVGHAPDTGNDWLYLPGRGWALSSVPKVRAASTTASNNAGDTIVLAQTVPADALGTHGYLRAVITGDIVQNSGAGRTIEARAWYNKGLGDSAIFIDLVSLAIPSNATNYSLRYEFELAAKASGTLQTSYAMFSAGLPTVASLRNQMSVLNNNADLAKEWTFTVSFMMSVADPDFGWDVGTAFLETFYLT